MTIIDVCSSSMDNNNITLVIARYKEDIAWAQDLPYAKVVYDKSGEALDDHVSRPNIGREAETWLYHIVQNYDSLSAITVLLQGHPFDHGPQKDIQSVSEHIKAHMHTNTLVGIGIDMHEPWNSYGLPIFQKYRDLFSCEPPSYVRFTAGAMYIVPRDLIRSRPLEFYKKLHAMVLESTAIEYFQVVESPSNIDPWTLERLWPYIWDPNTPLR